MKWNMPFLCQFPFIINDNLLVSVLVPVEGKCLVLEVEPPTPKSQEGALRPVVAAALQSTRPPC